MRTLFFVFIYLFTLVALTAYRDSFFPQRVIDGGLLYSGQITYQSNSFMYKVLTDSFTLLHPIAGMLLILGIGILKVSFIFQFTHLLVLALSTFYLLKTLKFNAFYSMTLVSILIFSIPKITQILTRNYDTLINTVHSYGQYGLTFSILVTCLLLRKKYLTLGITFPIFISIHIGWAAFMFVIIFSTVLSYKMERRFFSYKRFSIGFMISSVFLIPIIYYFIKTFRSSFYTPRLKDYSQLYKLYIENWDYHRSFNFDFSVLLSNMSLLLLVLIFLGLKSKIYSPAKLFLTLVSYGIVLSSSLYILNDKILDNTYIPLSSIMPSRFFNFQAYLSLIVISVILQFFYNSYVKNLKSNITYRNSKSFTLVFILSTFIFYLFNPSLGTNTNFNLRPLSFYERTNFSEVCANLKENEAKNVILTYGNISRFIPLFCREPILIDTTQIDFVPYLPETIPYLARIMGEIYGIPFSNKDKLQNLYRNDFNPWFDPKGPSGMIEPIYQETLWSLRSENRWQYLSCQYGFNKIVTNYDLKLLIDDSVQIDNFNIYSINPTNCSSLSNTKYIDIFSSTIVEFSEIRNPFIWLNKVPTTINLQSFSNKTEQIFISLNLSPNPCKLSQKLTISVNGKNQFLEVGSRNSSIKMPVSLDPNNYTEFVLTTLDINYDCKVGEDERNLVAKIDSINFTEE
jgi:hypothetical protein